MSCWLLVVTYMYCTVYVLYMVMKIFCNVCLFLVVAVLMIVVLRVGVVILVIVLLS